MKRVKEKISIDFEIEYDEVQWGDGWIPKTVYKYRDWENKNHKKVLTEQSIWISDSFDFNDPFDCNIPVSYELLNTDEVLAEKFIRDLVNNNEQIPKEKKEDEIN